MHQLLTFVYKIHLYFLLVWIYFQLQNPQFFATAKNPSHNYQIPTQTIIPIKQDILQELQRHIFFRYRNGVVKHIFHKNNEEMWVVNLKRGIINLFSVDTMQQNFDEAPMSKKLEVWSISKKILLVLFADIRIYERFWERDTS